VRWNLKEAVGKILARGTRSKYKAYAGWTSLLNKTKSNVIRDLWSKFDEYMR